MSKFHLYDEPWIWVATASGGSTKVGILELLLRGGKYGDLANESALTDFAILRTLVAFIHRAYDNMFTAEDWKRAWRSGCLDEERVMGYADRWRHRFWLIDDDAPFYQTPTLTTESAAADTTAGGLIAYHNGRHPLHSRRSADSLRAMPFDEAARHLVTCHAYDTAGNKTGAVGDPTTKACKSSSGVPGWCGNFSAIVPLGDTFLETLLLNTIPSDAGLVSYPETDVAAWEKPVTTSLRVDGRVTPIMEPAGPITLYTLQSRRVRLYSDGEVVTRALVSSGDRMTTYGKSSVETHAHWRWGNYTSFPSGKKTEGYKPWVASGTNRWQRVITHLAPPTKGKDESQDPVRAAVYTSVHSSLRRFIGRRRAIRFAEVSAEYGTQNSVLNNVSHNTLTVPVSALDGSHSSITVRTIQQAFERVEGAVYQYGLFRKALESAGGGRYDREAMKMVAQRAVLDADNMLDGVMRNWVADLGPTADRGTALKELYNTVVMELFALADRDVQGLPSSVWVRCNPGEAGSPQSPVKSYDVFRKRVLTSFKDSITSEGDGV